MVNSGIAKEIRGSENITELDKSRWQKKLEDEGFAKKIIFSCLNMFFAAFGLNGAFILSNEKLAVKTSVSIQSENVLQPANLADFEIKDGVLVKYNGNSADVVIPYGVTSIGYLAFKGCRELTSVVIPDSVTSIGNWAFDDCGRLAGIDFLGTKAHWKAIRKGWLGINTVKCLDGTIKDK